MQRLLAGLSGAIFSLTCGAAFAVPASAVDLMLSAPGATSITITGTPSSLPSYNGTFDGYLLTVGAVGNASLVSYAIQIASTPATLPVLTVSLTETGLIPDGPQTVFTSYNTAILHTASSVLFQTYYDPTDSLFGETDLASQGTVTGPNSAASTGPTVRIEDIATTYSLTKVVTLTPAQGAAPAIGGQVYIAAPEPMSLTLLGAGLGMFGFCRRVTRRRGPAA